MILSFELGRFRLGFRIGSKLEFRRIFFGIMSGIGCIWFEIYKELVERFFFKL